MAVLVHQAPARPEGPARAERADDRANGDVFGVGEDGDVLPDQLLLRVAEHVGRGAVDREDVAERVRHENARGEIVEELDRQGGNEERFERLHAANLALRAPNGKGLNTGPLRGLAKVPAARPVRGLCPSSGAHFEQIRDRTRQRVRSVGALILNHVLRNRHAIVTVERVQHFWIFLALN